MSTSPTSPTSLSKADALEVCWDIGLAAALALMATSRPQFPIDGIAIGVGSLYALCYSPCEKTLSERFFLKTLPLHKDNLLSYESLCQGRSVRDKRRHLLHMACGYGIAALAGLQEVTDQNSRNVRPFLCVQSRI